MRDIQFHSSLMIKFVQAFLNVAKIPRDVPRMFNEFSGV